MTHMTKWIDVSQVADLLKPGMTVFIAGATAEPSAILEELSTPGKNCAGVHFVSVSIPGLNTVDFSSLGSDVRSTNFFATPQNKSSMAAGRVDYIPLQYRAIYDYLERDLDIDIAIIQFPPVGSDGMISHGVSSDFVPAVLASAKVIIGEINDRQPSPPCSLLSPENKLDYAIRVDRPVLSYPPSKISGTAKTIANHVADLINDGDCLQIGIGSIPEATLAALTHKKNLRFHSGMISDGVMGLAKAGVMSGTMTIGATLGSQELINWVGSNEHIKIRPVSHTHDPRILGEIDNFVSINSALEIDLFGQVNADMLNAQQVSGTGGSVDMMRGAALSKGGRSIVALNATASGGTVSRIVTRLSPQNATTALRSDIDYVVTEYGVRRLKHLSVNDRAAALIELAAPEFREALSIQ